MYSFEIVGQRYFVVVEPSLIPQIVGRGSAGLPKSSGYAMWDAAVSPHAGIQGLFTVEHNTHTWRAVRKSYGPALGPGSLSSHFPVALGCVSRLGDLMERLGAGGAMPIEVSKLARCATMDLLGACAFGVDFGCLRDPDAAALPRLIEETMHECGERTRSVGRRLAPWLPAHVEKARRGAEAMAAFHKAVEDVWVQIKARGPPEPEDNSMGAQLLRLADPARGNDAMSDAQICAEIATLIIGGYETTANATTWILFALHAHPEAAQQLLAELRQAGVAPPAGAASFDVTAAFSSPSAWGQLSSLPCLDAFIRECMRLYSATPNGVLKGAPAEGPPVRIGDYEVPPGATVWVPFWSLHNSSRNWERPDEFRLDRWLGQDPRSGGALSASRCPVTTAATAIRAAAGFATQADNGAAAAAANAVTRSGSGSSSGESAVAAAAATLVAAPPAGSMAGGGDGGGVSSGSESDGGSGGGTRRAGGGGGRAIRYMPFADGSRNCVGQHLAMLMLKVTTAYLASRFALRLAEEEMGGVAGALDRMRVNLTLEVEGGMWMHAEPRTLGKVPQHAP